MTKKRQSDIMLLKEPFRFLVAEMIHGIVSADLPFVVFETFRSEARQKHLKARGVTRAGPGQSPHEYGLAVDFILDLSHPFWDDKPDRPEAVDGGGAAWDTGTKHGKVERPSVYGAWLALEQQALRVQHVDWGGRWKSSRYAPLGWDCPHFELRGWKSFKAS